MANKSIRIRKQWKTPVETASAPTQHPRHPSPDRCCATADTVGLPTPGGDLCWLVIVDRRQVDYPRLRCQRSSLHGQATLRPKMVRSQWPAEWPEITIYVVQVGHKYIHQTMSSWFDKLC